MRRRRRARHAAGLVGTIQATEAVKLILGIGEPLVGRLLLFDALAMRFRELKVRKNPDCVVCGPRPSVTRLIDYEAFCGTSPGARTAAPSGLVPTVHGHLPELNRRGAEGSCRDRGEKLVLVDVREPREWAISDLGDSVKIPLGTLPPESRQALEGRRDRRLLPHGRPQRQRRRVPARARLRKGPQPRRRHQSRGRSGSTSPCRGTEPEAVRRTRPGPPRGRTRRISLCLGAEVALRRGRRGRGRLVASRPRAALPLGDDALAARRHGRDRPRLHGFAGEAALRRNRRLRPRGRSAAAGRRRRRRSLPSGRARGARGRAAYIRSNAFCFSPCVSAVTSRYARAGTFLS